MIADVEVVIAFLPEVLDFPTQTKSGLEWGTGSKAVFRIRDKLIRVAQLVTPGAYNIRSRALETDFHPALVSLSTCVRCGRQVLPARPRITKPPWTFRPPRKGARSMYRIIIGPVGSDAGYWYIGADGKLHHVPGWNPEAVGELRAAVNIMREATRLKTPGVAEAAVKSVMEFTQRELASHLKQGQGAAGEGVVLVLG